jgi:hypothetical protein
VTQDDLLYRFRLRTFVMAGELGNVWAACRAMEESSIVVDRLVLDDHAATS